MKNIIIERSEEKSIFTGFYFKGKLSDLFDKKIVEEIKNKTSSEKGVLFYISIKNSSENNSDSTDFILVFKNKKECYISIDCNDINIPEDRESNVHYFYDRVLIEYLP